MARSDPEKLAQALRANLRRRKGPQGPGAPALESSAPAQADEGASAPAGAMPGGKALEKP